MASRSDIAPGDNLAQTYRDGVTITIVLRQVEPVVLASHVSAPGFVDEFDLSKGEWRKVA